MGSAWGVTAGKGHPRSKDGERYPVEARVEEADSVPEAPGGQKEGELL